MKQTKINMCNFFIIHFLYIIHFGLVYDNTLQWYLIITVALGPSLAHCYSVLPALVDGGRTYPPLGSSDHHSAVLATTWNT